jgi:drug/metabolite transporter (DMT)-like permease
MSEHHPRLLHGILLIMSAVFLFSSMDTLAKYMLRSYPLPPLIWARYSVHFAFMIALLAPRMGWSLVRTKRPVLQVLRGVALMSSTGFFYLALSHLPLAEAAAISFVAPVLVTSLSGPMLGERVTRRQWTAVSLGFLGVLIIIRPGGGLLTFAAVFPLMSAFVFALYQILTRKLAGRENPFTSLFYTALVGSIVTSAGLPFTWQTPTAIQALMMIAIGCLGGFGHFLMIQAVERASPSALAPFVYTQLIWSTLLAFIAFREFPEPLSLFGILVIISAGLLSINWKQVWASSVANPPPSKPAPIAQQRTET